MRDRRDDADTGGSAPPRVLPFGTVPDLRAEDASDEDSEELVGLRQDDLDTEERERLVATLATDKGARDRARAMTLARQLGELPAPMSDLHPGHVLEALARRKRARRLTRTALAAVAVITVAAVAAPLAVWFSQPVPGRMLDHVDIEANATAAGKVLPLWRRGQLPADAELSLSVTTTGPGVLFVRERWGYGQVQPLEREFMVGNGHAAATRWEVQAGEHVIHGPVHPDHVPLDVTYEAWLCPPGTMAPSVQRCRADKVDVSWR